MGISTDGPGSVGADWVGARGRRASAARRPRPAWSPSATASAAWRSAGFRTVMQLPWVAVRADGTRSPPRASLAEQRQRGPERVGVLVAQGIEHHDDLVQAGVLRTTRTARTGGSRRAASLGRCRSAVATPSPSARYASLTIARITRSAIDAPSRCAGRRPPALIVDGEARRGACGATIRVAVEPLASLPPEAPRRHELLLDRRWAKARRPPGRLEQAACGGEVHVDADEVHERERAHREAGRGERRVDRLDRPRAGAEEPKRLEGERPVHAVDDEARRIGRRGSPSCPSPRRSRPLAPPPSSPSSGRRRPRRAAARARG